MIITQEQALELADKYLLNTGRVALRDNISVSKSVEGWRIFAKTTPIILGMDTEMTSFSIDGNTAEDGSFSIEWKARRLAWFDNTGKIYAHSKATNKHTPQRAQ
jgi:hypothetical protein